MFYGTRAASRHPPLRWRPSALWRVASDHVAQYPGLVEEDIRACIAYGSERSRERAVPPERGAA